MKLITYTIPHTASTLVANINTGFMEAREPILFAGGLSKSSHGITKFINSERLTLKGHSPVDVFLKRIKEFSDSSLYFVFVNRPNRDQIQGDYSNVIVLDYNKLLYRSESLPDAQYSLDEVLNYVLDIYTSKMKDFDRYSKNLHLCKSRILKMDERYSEIKNLSFDYVDPFFHIHGSHKNKGYHK
jgi:hypothetical protein